MLPANGQSKYWIVKRLKLPSKIIIPNAIAGLSNGPDLITFCSCERSSSLIIGSTSPPSVVGDTPSGVRTSPYNSLLEVEVSGMISGTTTLSFPSSVKHVTSSPPAKSLAAT